MNHPLAHTYAVQERETIVRMEDVWIHTLYLMIDQVIPWHKHSEVDETFMCLFGGKVVRREGERGEITLRPGGRYTVPAGVGHFVKPDSNEGTKFLLIQATGKHDFVPMMDSSE